MERVSIEFGMYQCFSNWIQDFEMELDVASKKDSLFLQERLDLCETYIKHFAMDQCLFLENMIRGKAECL